MRGLLSKPRCQATDNAGNEPKRQQGSDALPAAAIDLLETRDQRLRVFIVKGQIPIRQVRPTACEPAAAMEHEREADQHSRGQADQAREETKCQVAKREAPEVRHGKTGGE